MTVPHIDDREQDEPRVMYEVPLHPDDGFSDAVKEMAASVAKARAETFDPLPLSTQYPEHDLLERAMLLISNAHRKAVGDVTEEDGASPMWGPAARWWLDQYGQWNHRSGLLKTLSAAAFHQAALITKCQITVGEVSRLADDCLEAGVTEQQVRKVMDDAQAAYAAKNPGATR